MNIFKQQRKGKNAWDHTNEITSCSKYIFLALEHSADSWAPVHQRNSGDPVRPLNQSMGNREPHQCLGRDEMRGEEAGIQFD